MRDFALPLIARVRVRPRVRRSGRDGRTASLWLAPLPWLATALTSLVLNGCPLGDDYAIARDAGVGEAGAAGGPSSTTGGKDPGSSLRDSGDITTGGDSSSGGDTATITDSNVASSSLFYRVMVLP